MEAYVTHRREGSCGILEFGNPAGNSLPGKLLEKLHKKLHHLEEDDQVAVIVLQSMGNRAFCGGASFSEMKGLKTVEEATAFFMGFAKVINQIRNLSKFIIAQVQGKVVGGGLGLVAACDYVIAHESAGVKLSELSIGIGPFVIEPAVSRKIGTTAFAQLSLEAERLNPPAGPKRKGFTVRWYRPKKALKKRYRNRPAFGKLCT